MALQTYARLSIAYNGNWLTQVTSVSHTTNSGNQRVDLLNEGLAGFTPGSGDCEIEIGYAVPIGGPEDNYQQDCANKSFVTLQLQCGAVGYIGNGWIDTNKISQSTNQSVEGTATWKGELRPFE
jgi:hypothetical protein